MSDNLPKIGIVTGGGDCPGINTVIYSAVKASAGKYEVIGISNGFEGLLTKNVRTLTSKEVHLIQGTGGTILGTANKGHFASKRGDGEIIEIASEHIQAAVQGYHDLGLQALISIGGDGTMSTAIQLYHAGINIVGVPKTIDNDLYSTDKTFGFDSAVEYVTDAIDRLLTTAASHNRIMLVEVMGRHAGWIALMSGIAGGAHMVLIPEIPFTYSNVLQQLKVRFQEGRQCSIVVVAEGAHALDEDESIANLRNEGEVRLGGLSEKIQKYIEANFTEQEVRSVVLGHLQRGGRPSSTDRILASLGGVRAVDMIDNRQFGKMVSYDSDTTKVVDISDAINQLKLVDPKSEYVNSARALGIKFGDLPAENIS